MRRLLLALALTGCASKPESVPATVEPGQPLLICYNDFTSPYQTRGSNLSWLGFGTRRTSIEQEFTEAATSSHWQPRARVLIGRVETEAGEVNPLEVRQRIQRLRVGLRACHENSSEFDRLSRYPIDIRVRWTWSREVEVLSWEDGELDPQAAGCLLRVLDRSAWPEATPGAVVSVRLVLSAQ